MEHRIASCVFFIAAAPCVAASLLDRESIATCIVQLEQKRPALINVEGEMVELWIKKPGSSAPEPKFDFVRGTGFLVSSDTSLYLVTASHVAKPMTASAEVILKGDKGLPFRLPLSQLSGSTNDPQWAVNAKADVAALRLHPSQEVQQQHLQTHSLPLSLISTEEKPPSRDARLTVFGFPLGLGATGEFSPLTRQSNPASGFLDLKRFDNGQVAVFFILEDPSIGGYSGGPVFDIPISKVGSLTIMGEGTQLVGLIHGTISDQTGGKLAAVVPSHLIVETIALANRPSEPK